MKRLIVTLLGISGLISSAALGARAPITGLRLAYGYVYRVRCDGRLLVSAVGNESLIRLDALPRELGCGAVLKPLQSSGKTNLIFETSAGTVIRAVEIVSRLEGGAGLEIDLTGRAFN